MLAEVQRLRAENAYLKNLQALDRLQYGNCDISDWEGRLNTNNSNRALTGFWIESSLMISPKEQVEVMGRLAEFVDLLNHPVADKTQRKRESREKDCWQNGEKHGAIVRCKKEGLLL